MDSRDLVRGRIAQLEELVRLFHEKSKSVLYASNGVSDNEWKTAEGVVVPEWPIGEYAQAIADLNEVYELSGAYLNPAEAEKSQKWEDACCTADFIVAEAEKDGSRRGSLHRNIADAINGTLRQSYAEREAGIKPRTMDDALQDLVAAGQLHEVKL